ncbi:MAG: formate dehydrogenase accessory protein FdhE [Desulfobacterales bacterium]|nr:formate dehydrogenase accessory protein FdhE [Desulfobacterales bacterium]
MSEKQIVTADKIKKAVAAVKALRPAYEGLLDFYEKLFLAQEDTKGHIHIEPIQIAEDLLSVKRQEKFPLINRADFTVDVKASEDLLRKICQLATDASDVLAEAGTKVMDALDKGTLYTSVLFSKILSDDNDYFDEVAKNLEIDKKLLAFMAYGSMKPSLCLCAEQLSTYLGEDTQWEKGYCPICGSPPALSILRGEGERSLICTFCSHEWQTPRIYCPFCDNRDQKTLHYFFSEEERDYRVDVCDKCHKYIKTVDTRKMKHPVYPFVEQISTLHLDMLAQEKGLESGIPLWLQT